MSIDTSKVATTNATAPARLGRGGVAGLRSFVGATRSSCCAMPAPAQIVYYLFDTMSN